MTNNQDASELLGLVTSKARECLRAIPVIILGSGASMPDGLPSTGELSKILIDAERQECLDTEEADEWKDLVRRLKTGSGPERILEEIRLSTSVQNIVVKTVWNAVQHKDEIAFHQMVAKRTLTPLARLYNFLFSSSNLELSVVTTNYDRLAEYGADMAGRWHSSGFMPGYFSTQQADHPYRISIPRTGAAATPIRKVNVWKVHGSLDWFMGSDGDPFTITAARSIPPNCTPAIVTPGLNKYAQTHQEPFRSVLSGADRALDTASAYLCVGYGFNDQHIHPRLVKRWRAGQATLLVLARTLSREASELFADPKEGRFLVFERSTSLSAGTRVTSNLFDPIPDIPESQLWNLPNFLEHVI